MGIRMCHCQNNKLTTHMNHLPKTILKCFRRVTVSFFESNILAALFLTSPCDLRPNIVDCNCNKYLQKRSGKINPFPPSLAHQIPRCEWKWRNRHMSMRNAVMLKRANWYTANKPSFHCYIEIFLSKFAHKKSQNLEHCALEYYFVK